MTGLSSGQPWQAARSLKTLPDASGQRWKLIARVGIQRHIVFDRWGECWRNPSTLEPAARQPSCRHLGCVQRSPLSRRQVPATTGGNPGTPEQEGVSSSSTGDSTHEEDNARTGHLDRAGHAIHGRPGAVVGHHVWHRGRRCGSSEKRQRRLYEARGVWILIHEPLGPARRRRPRGRPEGGLHPGGGDRLGHRHHRRQVLGPALHRQPLGWLRRTAPWTGLHANRLQHLRR